MSVERSEKLTNLTLKVEYLDKTKNKNFSYINPNASDEDVYNYGVALSGLQSRTLDRVVRKDTVTLVE